MKKIKNDWRERFEKNIKETKEGIQELVIPGRVLESLPCGYQKGSPELLQQLDGQSGYHKPYSLGFMDSSLSLKEISPLAAQHDIRARQRHFPSGDKIFPKYNTNLKDFPITQLTCYKEDMIPTIIDTSRPINPIEQLSQLKDIEISYVKSPKNKLPLDYQSLHYTRVGIHTPLAPHLSESRNHVLMQVQQKEDINGVYTPQVASTVKLPFKSVKSQQSPISNTTVRKNGAPRKKKPLMSETVEQMLARAKVNENDGMDCLYGTNIDKFRELVSFISAELNISEAEVKAILSQNRREVKNRGSARRSRLGRNDQLISLRKEKNSLQEKLSRLQWLTKKNLEWKKKYEKLRNKIESREYNWQFENYTSKRKFEKKAIEDIHVQMIFNANKIASDLV